MGYYNESYRLFLENDVTNNTITMQPISDLTLNLDVGWYRIEFTPFYNVNATTTGTGWNFEGGSAIISNYSFRGIFSSTTTANYENNYVARNQNFTTVQTSRLNDNRGTIIAEFEVTTSGTIIPFFRSEIAGGLVTLKRGSYLIVTKLK